MCKVCDTKEKQKNPITEIGKLLQKREKSLLMGQYDEAKELRTIILDAMSVVLKVQEELPNLLSNDTDYDVILCMLQKRKRDSRVGY